MMKVCLFYFFQIANGNFFIGRMIVSVLLITYLFYFQSIYYTPYVKSKETGKKIYPKGKLYEAYKSFTAKLRGQKLRNSNRTDQGHTADTNAISYHEDDDIKYLYEIGEDVPIVKEKWERTYEKRQKIFQGLKRSSDIIKKFKCLRNPTGYQYVSFGIYLQYAT